MRRSTRPVTLHGSIIPAGKPVFLVGWATASTVASAPHWRGLESTIALDRMLDFMPRYEVDLSGCQRVNTQNVAGWRHVPVRALD